MNYFSYKLSDPKNQSFADSILRCESKIEIIQLNQLSESLQVGDYCFMQLGGDYGKMSTYGSNWPMGLAGLAMITTAPYNFGYDSTNPKNFKITVAMKIVFDPVLVREEFIPYKNAYNAAGIGPATKGVQNQAIKSLEKEQFIAIIRCVLDKQPNLEPIFKSFIPIDLLQDIMADMEILQPKITKFKENLGIPTNTIFSDATNELYYGVPGCGKSYQLDMKLFSENYKVLRVVFHPDYSYSDFIGQIRPLLIDGNIQYQFIPGPFTEILKLAFKTSTIRFALVIEEINRGNAPGILGDIFQLLDRKETGESVYSIVNRDIALYIYGDANHEVNLPSNLSFFATMNTSDQSVFSLDTAFKRRWKMKLIKNEFSNHPFADKTLPKTNVTWRTFAKTINTKISEGGSQLAMGDKRLGAFFVTESELRDENIRSFAEKVLMYLWDDVFRYNRDTLFNIIDYQDLESLIEGYLENSLAVFTISFKEEIIEEEV